MNMSSDSPETLQRRLFDLIEQYRSNLKRGDIDMSRMEEMVQEYCEAVAALPVEEGRRHAPALTELMRLISGLGEELAQERDSVVQELGKLERMRKANVAYKSSDGMAVIKNEDSE